MSSERHPVCRVSELPPGSRKIIQVGKKSVGVFNVGGQFHALLNLCPHQFAPLCEGRITGTSAPSEVGEYKWIREGEIIRCPWHGWEFEIATGRSIFNPHRVKTRSYPVACGTEEDPTVESFDVEVVDAMLYVLLR